MVRNDNTLVRLARHRWNDRSDVDRALPPEAMQRLAARVAASEQRHSGEIRVCVEPSLPTSYVLKGLVARDRAIMMFGKLRVWDTEHNNGVLIYLMLAERAIEIVADRGLNRHVGRDEWQAIVDRMREALQAGRFEDGLNDAIDAVDALLARHFPLGAGETNPNELPDAPWRR
jgi:uncharacterized membrane protein